MNDDDAGVGVCDSTGDELFVPLPTPILQPPPPPRVGVLNKDGCISFPNNHGPPKLDELLGAAVDVFEAASPKGPPEAFPIPEEDRASETPSSMNLKNLVRFYH